MAKFMRRGKMLVDFLPTIAGGGAPTAAEVTAGTSLTARVADISGWMLGAARIDVPDMSTRFVSSIPGEQTVDDSTITFYADDAAVDAIKTALATDTAGYIYLRHGGAGTGLKADVFAIRVMSVGNEYSIGNDPARYVVTFAITAAPRIDVAQP